MVIDDSDFLVPALPLTLKTLYTHLFSAVKLIPFTLSAGAKRGDYIKNIQVNFSLPTLCLKALSLNK